MENANGVGVAVYSHSASVQKHMPTITSYAQDYQDIEIKKYGRKNVPYSGMGSRIVIPAEHTVNDVETLLACIDSYHKNLLETKKPDWVSLSKKEKKMEFENPLVPVHLQISVFGVNFPCRDFVIYYKGSKDKFNRQLHSDTMTDKQAFILLERAIIEHGEDKVMQPVAEALKVVSERRNDHEWSSRIEILKEQVTVYGLPEEDSTLESAFSYILLKHKLGAAFDQPPKAEKFGNLLKKAILKAGPEIRMKLSATKGPSDEDTTITETLFAGATDAYVHIDLKQLSNILGQKIPKRGIPCKSITVFEELNLKIVLKSMQQYPQRVSKTVSFLNASNKVVAKNGRVLFRKPVVVKMLIGGESFSFVLMDSAFGIGQIAVAVSPVPDSSVSDAVYRFGTYKEICEELDKGKPWHRQLRAQLIRDALKQCATDHVNWAEDGNFMFDKQRAAARELIVLTQVAQSVPTEGLLAEWINYKVRVKCRRQAEKALGDGKTADANSPRVDKLARAALKAISQGDAKFADMFCTKTPQFEPLSTPVSTPVRSSTVVVADDEELENGDLEPVVEPEPETDTSALEDGKDDTEPTFSESEDGLEPDSTCEEQNMENSQAEDLTTDDSQVEEPKTEETSQTEEPNAENPPSEAPETQNEEVNAETSQTEDNNTEVAQDDYKDTEDVTQNGAEEANDPPSALGE